MILSKRIELLEPRHAAAWFKPIPGDERTRRLPCCEKIHKSFFKIIPAGFEKVARRVSPDARPATDPSTRPTGASRVASAAGLSNLKTTRSRPPSAAVRAVDLKSAGGSFGAGIPVRRRILSDLSGSPATPIAPGALTRIKGSAARTQDVFLSCIRQGGEQDTARMAMLAMTTNGSMSVKAGRIW